MAKMERKKIRPILLHLVTAGEVGQEPEEERQPDLQMVQHPRHQDKREVEPTSNSDKIWKWIWGVISFKQRLLKNVIVNEQISM